MNLSKQALNLYHKLGSKLCSIGVHRFKKTEHSNKYKGLQHSNIIAPVLVCKRCGQTKAKAVTPQGTRFNYIKGNRWH